MADESRKPASTWARLGWFVGLWVASVVALGIVGMVLKWVLTPG